MATSPNVSAGYCACCGEPTEIAKSTDRRRNRVAGQPLRWVGGHHARKPNKWIEVDTGFKDPCWLWQLATTPAGYGLRTDKDGRWTYAHRVAYEVANRKIPAGRQIDHLCRERSCVNPAHLEAVT